MNDAKVARAQLVANVIDQSLLIDDAAAVRLRGARRRQLEDARLDLVDDGGARASREARVAKQRDEA